MQNKPKIDIPQNWFDGSSPTTYWSYKEGIWVDDDTKPILRLICVYYALLEIPQAREHLKECNQQFIDKFELDLIKSIKKIKGKAKSGEKIPAEVLPVISDTDLIAVYRPWVESWALNNDRMLEWVIGINVPEILLDLCNFKQREIKQLRKNMGELTKLIDTKELDLLWPWKVLITGNHKRIEQDQRDLARDTVRKKGFNTLRERQLHTHARCWISVRILDIKQEDLLDRLSSHSSKEEFKLTSHDLTDKILKPFDKAFSYRRKPGRPVISKI